MIHEKKIWPKYFEDIKSGKKNFDVRLADFDIKKNDTLLLKEWDPGAKQHTGRFIKKKVIYILKTKGLKFYKPKEIKKYGYYILGLK